MTLRLWSSVVAFLWMLTFSSEDEATDVISLLGRCAWIINCCRFAGVRSQRVCQAGG